MTTIVLPGVFRPRSDTRLLRDRMLDEHPAGQRVLELCVGAGLIAVAAAGAGAVTTATDINRLAAVTTRINAWRSGVQVEVLHGDLYEPVEGRQFDLIVANPPYVPTTHRTVPRSGASRAWDGGPGGRAVLDRIIGGLATHLRAGGRALLVHSSLNGTGQTIAALEANELRAEVVGRDRGPLGPLMSREVERGTVSGGHEDLVVVRAVREGPAHRVVRGSI
jgi:release factor glutamine methyltransferase